MEWIEIYVINFYWFSYCKDKACVTGPWMQTKNPQAKWEGLKLYSYREFLISTSKSIIIVQYILNLYGNTIKDS